MTLMLVLVFCFGCDKELTGDEKTAAEFVKAQGYAISSFKGHVQTYTLEKGMLYGTTDSMPIQQMWSVQSLEPERFFGKEISVYGFTVKKHPLEARYKAKTNVYIMLSEGKVIGGYSFPNRQMSGWVYSLDGKTLEETSRMSYKEWSELWKQKYGESQTR